MTRAQNPKHQAQKNGGFTLIEILVATSLFAALTIGVIGVMIDASRAHVKASQTQSVLDNIRFSLELLAREIRTGDDFSLVSHCNSVGPGIEFTNFTPNQRRYYYLADTNADSQPDAIMRIANPNPNSPDLPPAINPATDCPTASQFTGEEVVVERLNFYAQGLTVGWSDGQPWISIVLRVLASDPRLGQATTMDLQTTVTTRIRDF